MSDHVLAELAALGWFFIVVGGFLFAGLVGEEGSEGGVLFAAVLVVVGSALVGFRYVRRKRSGDDAK